MTIILTNDDGIDAEGIWSLQKATELVFGEKGAIAAPSRQYSGCGHQVTTNAPIAIHQRQELGENIYAIDGSPADCVRVAIAHLFNDGNDGKSSDVKLVLSGINHGGNMGVDVYMSGTVAAVREAAFYNIPAIAISHYQDRRRAFDWAWAAETSARVIKQLLEIPLPSQSYWNVNLPHLELNDLNSRPEIVFCEKSSQPLPLGFKVEGDRVTYAGCYNLRDRSPNTDVDVCFSGKIAVTQLSV
ncbi:5'/3'-nucleotidase SurE [Pseudanabaena sp. FACHB-1998]|uniref:5'/3'-nucleotidase SurE n=1 Tax=Pseudanabaena sp. FACHB-1998 TaxID=2692858 RepID=UPI0016816317|nr:5'/3'-nucleotidase SurE [Pseudanabaena sp. FACHB-1998]MBD2178287.1 5'/3'-nucleotidase SurE [Pseudanabaena sp. FACHB-1998]